MKQKLRADNISYKYYNSDRFALRNINLSVFEGEWISVLGPNGSGKSTLAKVLNGLFFPSTGEVTIDENLVLNKDSIWEFRKKVGMVFQNPENQFVGVTVEDDVAFGLENIGVPFHQMKEIVNSSLISVKMEGFEKAEPHKLSGGQMQRVAIAGVLAINPSIIILDEATSMLDSVGRIEVINTIKNLNKTKGITVISITHDLEEAMNSDRAIVLNRGEILFDGASRRLFQELSVIKQLSLDLPNIIKLKRLLEEKNIMINKEVYDLERLVDELWELNSKM